jgi:hypothetical protein
MNVGLHEDVYTTNTIEFNFFIFVVAPITHGDEIFSAGVVFLIPFSENGIVVEGCSKSAPFLGLNPRVVINCSTSVSCWQYDSQLRKRGLHFPSISRPFW